MTSTSLGRVQIIHGTPPNTPGKCIMCGTTEGSFVDIGFDIDFYGSVYWCVTNCFREVANTLEYYSPDQVISIKHEYNELVEHNKNLYVENAELRDALDSILRACKFSVANNSSVVMVEPEAESESAEQSITDSSTDEPEFTDREEGSTEQANEQRSTGLQCDDDFTELLGFNI